MSPYITPSSKMRYHNVQGSPGSREIHLSKENGVKDSSIDMLSCSWILAMDLHYFSSYMELVMCMPAIVTIVISLPLDKVLEVIVSHSTI
jgi:hypothetical protein